MQNEHAVLLDAVKAAGEAVLALQHQDLSIQHKANKDIVTQADLLANDILKSTLTARFPAIGWLSEESVDDVARLQCERVWVVDPIDGTIEYANRLPEYAVSVALVENGIPIVSAVYNPAKQELFHAIRGQGAWLADQRIYCDANSSERLLLLSSRSEEKRGEWEAYKNQHTVQPIGSIAYKLALIAAGKAHATFSLGPKSEWDIAAGVLLVEEAGGIATDKCQQPFQFNRKDIKVNGIVATSKPTQATIFALFN